MKETPFKSSVEPANTLHEFSFRLFWCNTHERRAFLPDRCGGGRGGITFPCSVVDLTGLCYFYEEAT